MTERPNPAADLDIRVIPVTPLQRNTSLPRSRRTNEGVFIDPGDDMRIVRGHGPASTVGQERQVNAFVADRVPAAGR